MERLTGARIQVESLSAGPERTITITGLPPNVQYAESLVLQKLNESANGYVPPEVTTPYGVVPVETTTSSSTSAATAANPYAAYYGSSTTSTSYGP